MKKCKVKKYVLEPKKLETAIRRAKKDLIEFAEKYGVYENFGMDHYRAIKDRYRVGLTYSEKDKHNMLVLKSFFDWCGKYNPRNSFYP